MSGFKGAYQSSVSYQLYIIDSAFCLCEGKDKFRHTVFASDNNIFIMAVNNALYQRKPETNAVFIQTSGTVRFMKAIKNIGKVIRRDCFSDITDSNICLLFILIKT